jgi:peptide/nickel transport system permease protein
MKERKVFITMAGVLLFILLFFFFLELPLFLTLTPRGIRFTPGRALEELVRFFRQVGSGNFNSFLIGRMPYELSLIFPECFLNSAILTLSAGTAGLLTGLSAGMLFSRFEFRTGVMINAFLSFIPDFLLAIVLQYLVIRLLRIFPAFPVTAAGYGEPVFVLPIIVICLCTGTYLAGSVYSRLRVEKASEHILYARARGISRKQIFLRHLFPVVVVHLRSDLRKYVSLILGNLFILERIFNIRGLSRLIFSFAYVVQGNFSTSQLVQARIAPQLNVAAVGLAGTLVLFFAAYWFLYGMLLLIQKGLQR